MRSLYPADNDPNVALNAQNVRRSLMFQLLLWDSIVLSDSQLLTDPCINVLMGNFGQRADYVSRYKIIDVNNERMRGFESLISNGYIEIARRNVGESAVSFLDLYSQTRNRPADARVPYLPGTDDYARHLDSLDFVARDYEISRMAKRFQNNLILGIGVTGYPQVPAISGQLEELFHTDNVTFAQILKVLKDSQNSGKINNAEFAALYDYVYSCYSVNVPAETNCYISTNFKNIPFHLEAGDPGVNSIQDERLFHDMNTTWALNPACLDLITFEEFVEIKKEIAKIPNYNLVLDFFKGTLKESDANNFCTTWNLFVSFLEMSLKNFLNMKALDLTERLMASQGIKIEQDSRIQAGVSLCKSVLDFAPVVGDVKSGIELIQATKYAITVFSKQRELQNMREEHAEIKNFLKNERIITRYDK